MYILMEQLLVERNKLTFLKNFLRNQIKKVEKQENDKINEIYDYCKEKEGHKFIYEKEPGPYGINYKYCTICGYEQC